MITPDAAIAVVARGMLKNRGNQQLVPLHQTLHAPLPSKLGCH